MWSVQGRRLTMALKSITISVCGMFKQLQNIIKNSNCYQFVVSKDVTCWQSVVITKHTQCIVNVDSVGQHSGNHYSAQAWIQKAWLGGWGLEGEGVRRAKGAELRGRRAAKALRSEEPKAPVSINPFHRRQLATNLRLNLS